MNDNFGKQNIPINNKNFTLNYHLFIQVDNSSLKPGNRDELNEILILDGVVIDLVI